MVYALPVTKLDYGSTKRGKASGTWDFLIARTRIHRDVCTLRTSRLWKIDVIFERAATKFFWTMTRVEMIQLNWLTSSFFSLVDVNFATCIAERTQCCWKLEIVGEWYEYFCDFLFISLKVNIKLLRTFMSLIFVVHHLLTCE